MERRHGIGRVLNVFKGNQTMWIIYLVFIGISLVAVFSSIGFTAIMKQHTTPGHAFVRHAEWIALSVMGTIFFSNLNYRSLSKWIVPGYLLAVILLMGVMLFGHAEAGSGTGRWIHFGKTSLGFQPSEFAKVVTVLFIARTLTLAKESLKERNVFLIIVGSLLLVVGLIFPQNLSTALILFVSCYTLMLFAETDKKMWIKVLLGIILVGLLASFIGSKMPEVKHNPFARQGTWSARVEHWLNPNPDELTQESLARMAVASGGLTGKGIGNTVVGRLMTEANNDFIYAIIIEECGMFIGIIIFLLFTVFFFCCIRTAYNCPGQFGRLMVTGLGTMIYLQAIIHMGVNVGALPVTGQTLPFISSGGSSYFFTSCALGIILSVSADTDSLRVKRKKQRKEARPSAPLPAENPAMEQTTELTIKGKQ
ncbi:MAG: FtsW/RodA/SpoVE family cell cycle protein [Bacteroidales bacterium]|nr:FtsW/RodA/SpoVE family cell cycle protein [Bacteroidales bacterium]